MLPPASRLTSGESFRRCVRRGSRSSCRTLVVHLDRTDDGDGLPARAGFVVSRAVGGAVLRNLVRRRLRHLVRERLDELPASSVLVVRANPAAAAATYDELRRDLGRCLERIRPVTPAVVGGEPS
ncbi:ribonuclease P protein component [Nocardioides agariphilus]|jgi:ribonuclease P protein component|uniref:Ribonuclease P protein component n=1 Tax=Nocardioides agariphilus TaxID=433664 RepID=A0A930VL32_9ACTN|nr:ribonuclease P protein component [Nocardioides agariphilus]MBF4767596.1 ribonuclease P protein component [Nocardioides agariphilus]